MDVIERMRFQEVVDEICAFTWSKLDAEEMTSAAWAYYYFSIQFRENLKIARRLHPEDEKLQQLEAEECETSNLSPWPGVAEPGEAMNHDEFMRRTISLVPSDPARAAELDAIGQQYLATVRSMDDAARAASIASYEDGGLERTFTAMLRFSHWDTPLLRAFQHFLSEHVKFDSDPDQGHGALSRHIRVDDRILPLWEGFRTLFVRSVPTLAA